MPQDLLSPDEFGQMLDDPEFAKLPFDTRKTYVEKGIGEASRFIAERDGGWTPERWQNFGAAAQQARQFVSESETVGETVKRYAGVAGQTIKDLPAIIGTGVVGLSPVLPDGNGGLTGQVPGETLGPALGRNIVGLAASGAAMLSDAEQPMVKQIDTLKQQIDQGEFLTHKKGFQAWMDEQNAAVREKQKAFYQNEDWADQNSLLGSAENVKLMQDYLTTRSPQSWAALQDNLLRTPFRAKLQADQQALENDTKLGRALAPEARPLISEAADPAELLPGMLAVKKGVQIATKGASAGSRALDAAKGIAGEMLGEQVSATIDNPYLSAAERLQVAKDSLAGSLGLMGVGAGAKAAVQALAQRGTTNPAPGTNDTLSPNQTPAPAGTPQAPGTTPATAAMAGAAGAVPSTLSRIAQESLVADLPEDTGALTAEEVAGLERQAGQEVKAGQDLAGVGQGMSDPSQSPPFPVSSSSSTASVTKDSGVTADNTAQNTPGAGLSPATGASFVDEYTPKQRTAAEGVPEEPLFSRAAPRMDFSGLVQNAQAVASGAQAPQTSPALAGMINALGQRTGPVPPQAGPRGVDRFFQGSPTINLTSTDSNLTANRRLADAYREAVRGSSTQMAPLSSVYAQARLLDRTLTVDQFLTQVKDGYNNGTLYLEGAGSQQEAAQAGLALPGTNVGTAIRMMPAPQAEAPLRNAAGRATNAAMASEPGAAQNTEPSPGGLSEAERRRMTVLQQKLTEAAGQVFTLKNKTVFRGKTRVFA